MHLKRKFSKYLFLGLFFHFNISCNTKSNECLKSTNGTDTLYYRLSKPASDTLDMLIGKQKIPYIYLMSNSDENNFRFTFRLIQSKNKSEKDDYILQHTNRYLKTDRHIIKIYNQTDKYFSISPKDSMDYISHYPTAGITVNATGDLLEYYSESYKLNKSKQ
jgi:hypothetical protein